MLLVSPAPSRAQIFTNIADNGLAARLTWSTGSPPFLLQKKLAVTDTNWVNVLSTSNRSMLVAKEAQSGFFRIQNQSTNIVLPFTVLMNGAAEVPVTTSTASAVGSLSLEGSNLTYYVAFSGLSTNATAARFHSPSTPTGTAGVSIGLTVTPTTSGVISGTVLLTQAQITNLINGLIYLNIHTVSNPGGEIRGQVVPLSMVALLNGASEIPATASSGVANAALFFVGSQLYYQINYSGLSTNVTGAHIHGPAATTNTAPVIIPFSTPGGTSGTISGSVLLTPAQMGYVLGGQTYLNIHTVSNPGGEIRGQIWPVQLGATMNGASEVPANGSVATGTLSMNVVSNLLSYTGSFSGLTGSATAGHIHAPGYPGQIASVIIPFTIPSATSGTFSGTVLLTAQQLFYLMSRTSSRVDSSIELATVGEDLVK